MFIKVYKCAMTRGMRLAGNIARLGEILSICPGQHTHTAAPRDATPSLSLPSEGGTYLIMCVIEKDATAVKAHIYAGLKELAWR